MSTLARPPTLPSAAATRVRPPTPDPLLPRFSLGAALAGALVTSPLLGIAVLAAIEADDVRGPDGRRVGHRHRRSARQNADGDEVARAMACRRGHPVSVVTGAFGAPVTLLSTISFSHGRQLRERGSPVFAPLVDVTAREGEAGWLVGVPVPTSSSEGGSAAEIGKTEHPSVGAFAQLAARLASLGAPARLIEDAHCDAVDEIRHARLCFSLARDIDGRA